MGQKPAFPCETTESVRGNHKSTGNSTAHLEVMDDALPHYGQREATVLCRAKGKFKADMPSLETEQLAAWDQLGSEKKRPRSQSIPVKTNTALADDSDRNYTHHCDLCTRRMYNRIVVHRLNNPVNVSQDVAPSVSQQQASENATLHSRSHSSHTGKLSSCEMVDPIPIPVSNFYLEGEMMFDLEL
jgi:hypothetical protein